MKDQAVIIGIAGGSASGKTSIAKQLYDYFKGHHKVKILKQDDYTLHTRSDITEVIEKRDVIILEGIFVLAEATIRELCDILVYIDTDSDIRFIRRLKRDIEERGRSLDSVCQQYLKTVRPMHEQFIEPSKKYAHIIIPEGGSNHVAVDLLITKIKSIVDE